MSTSLEDSEAWLTWLQTVSEEERLRVASLISEFDTSKWNGIHKFMNVLAKEMLFGTVAPITVDSLMKVIDRQMAALFMEHRQANALDHYPASAHASLVELRAVAATLRPVEPKYLERPDSIDSDVVGQFRDEVAGVAPSVADDSS